MPRPSPRRALAAALVLAALLAGCRPGTVRLSFRPSPGDRYAYEVRVRSETVTRLGAQPPERSVDEAVLRADHRVLDADRDGVRVEVTLARRGSPPRTFVVRFDRAAQLAQIERVEGLPVGVFGDVGLAEIFPAAAGAPPTGPLGPGDRWAVDAPVRLPGSEPTRLSGRGRLVELGVDGGRELATVTTRTRLPLRRASTLAQGTLALDGTQATSARTTYDLADGAVERSTSRTEGRFSVLLSPPPGQAASPIEGTLTVEVRSETRRLPVR